ncbi:MAG: hypothetical protein ABI789_01190 [Usitatibacter sp.]
MTRIDNDSQIAGFLAKYTPAIETQLRDARARLRAFFPRGFELVFDNYNALVFGISPTERSQDAFVSVVGYPRWVTLFFLHGTDLNDPNGLLKGEGKQVRSIRLNGSADINSPAVTALINQAAKAKEAALHVAPSISTVVKTVVAKQRPRRPSSPSRKPSSKATSSPAKR